MSAPKIREDHDSTSPHLSTQISNEKTKKTECPNPAMPVNDAGDMLTEYNVNMIDPRALHDELYDQKQMIGGEPAAESEEMNEESGPSTSQNDPHGYLPVHLNESTEPNCHNQEDKDEGNLSEPPNSLPLGARIQDKGLILSQGLDDKGNPVTISLSGYAACTRTPSASGQSTPTGYIQRRIPSSSIPHLLSSATNSNRSSVDAAHLMLGQQLAAMGTGVASPCIHSRDESFAFSVDGDDPAYKAVGSSPQVNLISCPQSHLVKKLRQSVLASPGGGSNLSSCSSLAFVSPAHNAQYNSHLMASPPQEMPMPGLKIGPDMPQLSQLPLSDEDESLNPSNRANTGGGKIETPVPSEAVPPCGLPVASQCLSNRYPVPISAVQPVLYSAINSLEKYNAGSFENKVMAAKARGRYGRQKAFPGVPQKKSDQTTCSTSAGGMGSSLGSGVDLESKDSPVVDKEDGLQQTDTGDTSAQMDQVGVEQLIPIMCEPSKTRLYKSRSSGTLSNTDIMGRAESLEELKKPRRKNSKSEKFVTINDPRTPSKRGRRREKKVGVFRPSSDAYTPRMGNRDLKYKPAQERASVDKMSSTMGTIQRPNFRDALRRVAIILHQHIVKIEGRFSTGVRGVDDTGLFKASMRDHFNEDNFATPRYKCSMVRVPMARPGVVYSMRKIQVVHTTPTTDEIYEFAHQLFKKVQLSSECSIVCLIYVEKLMEVSKVPLVANTWRPIFMAGLLLASKVWQDLSSWNIEFASVYPQFSLNAINRLELSFLKFIKWDLYISSSLYAKYYFALRSLLEKSGFRDRYNQMVGGIGGIAHSEAMKVSKRSEAVKEEALLQLSQSM